LRQRLRFGTSKKTERHGKQHEASAIPNAKNHSVACTTYHCTLSRKNTQNSEICRNLLFAAIKPHKKIPAENVFEKFAYAQYYACFYGTLSCLKALFLCIRATRLAQKKVKLHNILC
jgi:hypothetical protein